LRNRRSKSGLIVGGRFVDETCGRFSRSARKSPPVGSGAGGVGTGAIGGVPTMGGNATTGGGSGGGGGELGGGRELGGGGVGGVGAGGCCCAARAAAICSFTRASSWRMMLGLFHAPAASTRKRPTVIGDGPVAVPPITSGERLTCACGESSPCTL
jgi:hypothetical protein